MYLVEDNGWAISVRASDQAPAPISELVQGFRGLAVYKVDGTDYFACRSLAAEATARVRAGEGPCLIHATVTRPYSHSSQDTQSKYRLLNELEEEATRDPILRLERELTEGGVITSAEAAQIRESVRAMVAEIGQRGPRGAKARPGDGHRSRPRTARHSRAEVPLTSLPGEAGNGDGQLSAWARRYARCSSSR